MEVTDRLLLLTYIMNGQAIGYWIVKLYYFIADFIKAVYIGVNSDLKVFNILELRSGTEECTRQEREKESRIHSSPLDNLTILMFKHDFFHSNA